MQRETNRLPRQTGNWGRRCEKEGIQRMTFFEQELQKLFGHDAVFADTRFVGNACYGRLTDNIRVKINFQTGGDRRPLRPAESNASQPERRANRRMVLRFQDLWGIKQTSNPNFREGVSPYIWDDYGKTGWYVYKQTKTDYRQLSEAVGTYLSVFQEPVQEQQMGQKMILILRLLFFCCSLYKRGAYFLHGHNRMGNSNQGRK